MLVQRLEELSRKSRSRLRRKGSQVIKGTRGAVAGHQVTTPMDKSRITRHRPCNPNTIEQTRDLCARDSLWLSQSGVSYPAHSREIEMHRKALEIHESHPWQPRIDTKQ